MRIVTFSLSALLRSQVSGGWGGEGVNFMKLLLHGWQTGRSVGEGLLILLTGAAEEEEEADKVAGA